MMMFYFYFFFFSSRRRHTRSYGDWSSDACSSDLVQQEIILATRGDAVGGKTAAVGVASAAFRRKNTGCQLGQERKRPLAAERKFSDHPVFESRAHNHAFTLQQRRRRGRNFHRLAD